MTQIGATGNSNQNVLQPCAHTHVSQCLDQANTVLLKVVCISLQRESLSDNTISHSFIKIQGY